MTRLRRAVRVFLLGWEGERHRFYSDVELVRIAYERTARLIGEKLLPAFAELGIVANRTVAAFAVLVAALGEPTRRSKP